MDSILILLGLLGIGALALTSAVAVFEGVRCHSKDRYATHCPLDRAMWCPSQCGGNVGIGAGLGNLAAALKAQQMATQAHDPAESFG